MFIYSAEVFVLHSDAIVYDETGNLCSFQQD